MTSTPAPPLDRNGRAIPAQEAQGPPDQWDPRVAPIPVGPSLAPLPDSAADALRALQAAAPSVPANAPPPAPLAPAPIGMQIRRREVWVPLPDDVQEFYPGYQIRVWANAPRALLAELAAEPVLPQHATPDQTQAATARVAERRLAVLHQLVLEHNHWTDYDGREYPPCGDDSFWDGPSSIPTDLAVIVVALLAQGGLALPKSLQPRRRPS